SADALSTMTSSQSCDAVAASNAATQRCSLSSRLRVQTTTDSGNGDRILELSEPIAAPAGGRPVKPILTVEARRVNIAPARGADRRPARRRRRRVILMGIGGNGEKEHSHGCFSQSRNCFRPAEKRGAVIACRSRAVEARAAPAPVAQAQMERRNPVGDPVL